jgi:(1->4)-alpha-D-glucan 1-alpha-D-glucosylmutase
LVEAFHLFLFRTPAALKAIQLEDALGAIEQANLPGTIDEHPNWRRKISVPLEKLPAEQRLSALLRLFAETPHKASTIQTGSRSP